MNDITEKLYWAAEVLRWEPPLGPIYTREWPKGFIRIVTQCDPRGEYAATRKAALKDIGIDEPTAEERFAEILAKKGLT